MRLWPAGMAGPVACPCAARLSTLQMSLCLLYAWPYVWVLEKTNVAPGRQREIALDPEVRLGGALPEMRRGADVPVLAEDQSGLPGLRAQLPLRLPRRRPRF